MKKINNSKNYFSQNDFINSIIHELKTPLNAIIGFSEILKQEVRNPKSAEECADFAKEINQTALEMNDLVHDLLDVNSLASGNFSVDLSKEIDICEVIKRSVRINNDFALRRNIDLEFKVSPEVKVIHLDAKRMKQILSNLISNAIKYATKKTEVKITAKNLIENNKKYLEIIICDQGFGMTEAQIETAFQKYKTIKNPNSDKVDSFGLGLPISKQLVELQNGKIEIKSELHKGTEIILRFPYLM